MAFNGNCEAERAYLEMDNLGRHEGPTRPLPRPTSPRRGEVKSVSPLAQQLRSRTTSSRGRVFEPTDGSGALDAGVKIAGITDGLQGKARGPDWQRIIASFTGVGQEWVLPNWMIGAPGGKRPTTWPSRLFLFQQRGGAALGRITVLGASAAQGQALGGDISEALIFDRSLRFDETQAVTKYLNEKWGLKWLHATRRAAMERNRIDRR